MTELNSILRQWLVTDDQVYVEQEQSEHRVYRFEVPVDKWTDDMMPVRGTATPIELGAVGTVLKRHVDYRERPGFVVCLLTCGWSGWDFFDSLTRVSCRPVSMRRRLAKGVGADADKPLNGPVEDHEEDQRHVVDGDDEDAETYMQITFISILTPAQLTDVAAAFVNHNNDRNSAGVTFNGVTYATGTVKFTGMGSETIPASQSPTGSAAFRVMLGFLAGPRVWPTTVKRYNEGRVLQRVNVKAAALVVGRGRIGRWVRDTTSAADVIIRGEFDMGGVTALGLLP